MKLGWLCDSILKIAARPSPMSTTPAFSPGPCTTHGALVGSWRSQARDDLYEQCSDHITEKMPSSVKEGTRPMIASTRAYSSALRPKVLARAASTVGMGASRRKARALPWTRQGRAAPGPAF